jgi:hypothetical protein
MTISDGTISTLTVDLPDGDAPVGFVVGGVWAYDNIGRQSRAAIVISWQIERCSLMVGLRRFRGPYYMKAT